MIKKITYLLVFISIQNASLFGAFQVVKAHVARDTSEMSFLTPSERNEYVENRKNLFMTSLFENNVKRRILMHGLRPLTIDMLL